MATLLRVFPESSHRFLRLYSRDETTKEGEVCQCYKRYHFDIEEEKLAFLGYGSLALFLLLLCALLAGLTLAICSLDMMSLQVFSTSGDEKQRKKALLISRIKRNSTWFLCSMIVCSVTCTESLPIIVQSLFGTDWLPIIISTVAVAVFAELIPQYIIPRNAILWGYYCWPFIWGCMWLTCIISWPISALLDKISGPQRDKGIYTTEQLGILIKFHERTEKHGGILGSDAGRIIRGALNLDGRMLRGTTRDSSGKGKALETDVERGNPRGADIIVPWLSVRTVDVNEEVTREFVLRLRSWALSRIPVIGKIKESDEEKSGQDDNWKNQRIYGYVHLKNLVGIQLYNENPQATKLYVKDLPLYPLPVVRDDLPLYDLLNIFQLGVSRMAVVIPTPIKDTLVPLTVSSKNEDALPRHVAPLWSASRGLNTRGIIETTAVDAQIEWSTKIVDLSQNRHAALWDRQKTVTGNNGPKPMGIITYEDIIDALLQKTSKDEKDFFDRQNAMPVTKRRKEGDDTSVSSNHSVVRNRKVTPAYVNKLHDAFERVGGNKGTLRRRNVSAAASSNNGSEVSVEYGFDGTDDRNIIKRGSPICCSSSYTDNSIGGFHIENIMTGNASAAVLVPLEQRTPSQVTSVSPLTRTSRESVTQRILIGPRGSYSPFPRSSSCGKGAVLPRLRRTTRFAMHDQLSFDRRLVACRSERKWQIIPPEYNSRQRPPSVSPDRVAIKLDDSMEATSTDLPSGNSHMMVETADIEFESPVLVDSQAYSRNMSTGSCNERQGTETDYLQENIGIRLREGSFHDDRILLPSQRRLELGTPYPGRRRISL